MYCFHATLLIAIIMATFFLSIPNQRTEDRRQFGIWNCGFKGKEAEARRQESGGKKQFNHAAGAASVVSGPWSVALLDD